MVLGPAAMQGALELFVELLKAVIKPVIPWPVQSTGAATFQALGTEQTVFLVTKTPLGREEGNLTRGLALFSWVL